jgi:hypothetical protein
MRLPAEVASWIASCRNLEVGAAMNSENYTYYLISLGVQDVAGHRAEILGVDFGASEVTVRLRIERPAAGGPVAQPYHPVAVARSRMTPLPIRFVVPAAPDTWVPALVGVPDAFRVHGASDRVTYSPRTPGRAALGQIFIGTSGQRPAAAGEILVEGVARAFEGTVLYDVLGPDGQPSGPGFVTAAGGGPDWGYFVVRIGPGAQAATVRIYTASAEDGSMQDLVLFRP